MPTNPLIARAQQGFLTQDSALQGISADLIARHATIAAQQKAAAAAASASSARSGQKNAATLGTQLNAGARDMKANAGIYAGALQHDNAAALGGVNAQNANEARFQANVGAANQQYWTARATEGPSLLTQGRQTLYAQLAAVQNQIAQAEAQAAASRGGGGGGHRGGYGGSGSSGRPSLGFLGAVFDANRGNTWAQQALNRSRGTQGGREILAGIIGNNSPDTAARLYQTAVDRWNANRASGVRNGVSLTNLKRVLGQYQSAGTQRSYDAWAYNNARNAYKYG